MPSSEPHDIRLIEDRWATFRHIIEAVAIVTAGCWAFYTFVYQEKIKPAAEPAALNPSIAVARLGRDARREILSVTVNFKNSGLSEIDLAADAFNVWGIRYAAHESTLRHKKATHEDYDHEVQTTRRTLIHAFGELRDAAISGRKGAHFILEPGDTQSAIDTIVVPRGEYDVVEAQVIAVPVKTGSRKAPIKIVHQTDGSFWLASTGDDDEDDNSIDFALVP